MNIDNNYLNCIKHNKIAELISPLIKFNNIECILFFHVRTEVCIDKNSSWKLVAPACRTNNTINRVARETQHLLLACFVFNVRNFCLTLAFWFSLR